MATLQELKLRIASTKNIQKITKSMKMIASTKLNKAEQGMRSARVFGASVASLNGPLEFGKKKEPAADAKPGKELIVAISSDKGLCGGIHSSIFRHIRGDMQARADKDKVDLMSVGDKCRTQLQRLFTKNITGHFTGLGSRTPTYIEAAHVAETILSSEEKYSKITLIYNQYKSAIAYETTPVPVASHAEYLEAENIDTYDVEGDDEVLENLAEFNLANSIYSCLAEGHAAEIAAKMAAMDNATNNAGEVIDKLTIVFNRTRQAVITTELVDIITGASAL